MAIEVKLDELDNKVKEEMALELSVSSKEKFGYGGVKTVYQYISSPYSVRLPFYYGCQKIRKYPNSKNAYPQRDITFGIELRPYQHEVVNNVIQRFNAVKTCFISMATGKGKTMTSIYISSLLKLKTLVFLHRINLFDQWKNSILKAFPKAKIQVLDSKCQVQEDIDYYLINPINVLKRTYDDFKDIGFLIVDEAHSICSEKMSKSMLFVTPKYCVGLSATPDRTDGLSKILENHFGPICINVPLYVEHKYYQLKTGLVPTVKQNIDGGTNWESILQYQATHPLRNLLILRLCLFFKDRNILILCKRVAHTQALYNLLLKEKESVDYTDGSKTKFDENCRILVTTYSKSGEGFDHPKLDMLIVAGDVMDRFAQYFGRCVRREDVEPIFVDLIDSYKSLSTHAKTRSDYAKSVGGDILDFHKSFPTFNQTEIVFE